MISFRLKGDPGYTEFDVSQALRAFGWQVPAYTMPDDANVDDFADVNNLEGDVIDVDFENDADLDFAGMQMASEPELCATLDKFDEVVFWVDGWRKLANASKEFAGIVNSMNKKNKEKQAKLFAFAEERRRAGPAATHKKR